MNTCVCCGCEIPEGRQICQHCERKFGKIGTHLKNYFTKKNGHDVKKKYDPVIPLDPMGSNTSVLCSAKVQQGGLVKDINDILKVVRCKNCEHWRYIGDGCGECKNPWFRPFGHHGPTMKEEGFCSCAEERHKTHETK